MKSLPLSLPNQITIVRIFCIPFFILLLIYYDKSVLRGEYNDMLRIYASIIFLAIFISDALDGYIARSRNQITRLGTILDPLADKAMLLSALILISYSSQDAYRIHLPIWFVWLVICRDTMLVTGAVLINFISGAVTIRPRLSGKATTFFQAVLIIWALLNFPERPYIYLLWMATAVTVVSGIQYFFDGIKQFDKS
ncbi:MAG: CDP-alcohol phosphatidyltransferase family protein [Chitinispirillaceae bacterium]|nr:CDP-alcohol phosphatidyltransferase family protein [Chitinispirillaceae bacterium]